MDGGRTDNRPSGEQDAEVAQPGWYADPYEAPEIRWWDGERWTIEVARVPTPEEEQTGSAPTLFNWPALVATLVAAWFVASWVSGAELGEAWSFSPLLVMLFGGLGADPKYASGPGRFVALVLAAVSACLVATVWVDFMRPFL